MPTTPLLQLPYPTLDDPPDGPGQIQALAQAIEAHGAFIVGELRFVALSVAPVGWLLCDGRAVSRTTYTKLFTAIGALGFGAGDGSTTFNLPDVRGRALVGSGQGTGLTMRVIATKWGVEAVVLSTAQMPAHAHAVTDPKHGHTVTDPGHAHASHTHFGAATITPGTGYDVSGRDTPTNVTAALTGVSIQTSATGVTIQNNGGGQSFDNTVPSLAIPAFIYAGA